MRFASLGSGSRGNALVVDAGDTKLLLDCGFSTRAVLERLERLALCPEQLSGILVTHEHSDHVAGVFGLARRYALPVYLTHGTFAAAPQGKASLPDIRIIDSHSAFSVGGIEVQPFPVPHDAREPVQYVFFDGRHRLGVLTDAGSLTPHIVSVLRACDALVLECNHDREMLAESSYPPSLKRRISGRLGHLDNETAASLLLELDVGRLQHVIAAHLSEQNNRPGLAVQALASALGCAERWIGVAGQESGFSWRELL